MYQVSKIITKGIYVKVFAGVSRILILIEYSYATIFVHSLLLFIMNISIHVIFQGKIGFNLIFCKQKCQDLLQLIK